MIPQAELQEGNSRFARSFMVRNHVLGIAFACAIILSGSSTASAQTKQPSKPSTVTGSRQARDLSGVWMQDRPRPATVRERYWIYEFNPEEPPMTAWGEAQYKLPSPPSDLTRIPSRK